MLGLHTWCELWGKSGTCCVLFLYFLTSHCCNNNGIRVMFLLISAIEEITRYCCYFPGYYCAVAAICRATFLLQNCCKATSSTSAENSDFTACFCKTMQGINSHHIYELMNNYEIYSTNRSTPSFSSKTSTVCLRSYNNPDLNLFRIMYAVVVF